MAKRVLAGDTGGTKTILAVYSVVSPRSLRLEREATFASRDYRGLEPIVREFLDAGKEKIAAAAFGIAGPVVGDRVKTTNLPWVVRARTLAREIGCRRVRLLNDLEATAFGALFVAPRELRTLNRGKRRDGNLGVIAAGTGLGQAFLFWDGERHRPVPTEGGHVDFGPRNEKELALLVYLQKKMARVSYERVLSGPGLVHIFDFFVEALGRPVELEIRERFKTEDRGAVVGEAGVTGACPTCVEAVETFVSLYGAQAGNLALTVMSVAGVFVGGGIAVKLLPKMTDGKFMQAFVDKGRYRDFMQAIPVRIILNPKAALLGAGHAAAELAS
jgi:glucokinase